ncbi:hypothetical protein GIB67_042792 [Kingdonia uniflora]|uniref:Uncharacterized protein n=1 Tax=Kingdonia uniflora TaxID=39325 RepID=A0A7J7L154_9MAGN|nr:hypothetical protein GIB67_042792 [Kingdonia uniflora]
MQLLPFLATRGYDRMYFSATSAHPCTGVGNAMVSRVGLPQQDHEFVQFHPTGIYGIGCLITEGFRGEGAFSGIVKVSNLWNDVLKERLPRISETTAIFAGVDVMKEPIPVLPTVHYSMGGILTNFHGEAVIVKDACASVHGANKLGANSLLDLVILGRAYENRVAEIHKPGEKQKPLENDAGEKTIAWLNKLRYSNGSLPTSKIRLNMQRIIQNNAAVFRTQETLEEGCQLIDKAWESFNDVKLQD